MHTKKTHSLHKFVHIHTSYILIPGHTTRVHASSFVYSRSGLLHTFHSAFTLQLNQPVIIRMHTYILQRRVYSEINKQQEIIRGSSVCCAYEHNYSTSRTQPSSEAYRG